MLLLRNFHSVVLPDNPIHSKKPSPVKKLQLPVHQVRFTSSFNRNFRRTLSMAQDPVNQPQKVIILNKRSEKLVGLLHDTRSKEVVILCNGFCSRKEQQTMVNICVALEKEGLSSFRFDFSGNGESDGSFAYGNYMREVEDLSVVVKHFNEANRVVSAILGHSKGGNVVLLYASKYHDVRAVVNLSGRYDLKKGIRERLGEDFMERIKKEGYIDVLCKKTGKVMYRVTEESLMDRLSTDMHEACLKIDKDCRVLTVHGSADEIIPVEDAYEFSKIIQNHKLHIIEGANHGYSNHQPELAEVVVDFIKGCLPQERETSG